MTRINKIDNDVNNNVNVTFSFTKLEPLFHSFNAFRKF